MKTNFEKVGEFHKACDHPVYDDPKKTRWVTNETRFLRQFLIREELQEFIDADEAKDLVGVADALADLLYVVYGTAHCYGIDIDACFDEVHRSNMTKFVDGKVLRRKDGKILKPPTYSPPNLKRIVESPWDYLPSDSNP